jgi:hypothetical protein
MGRNFLNGFVEKNQGIDSGPSSEHAGGDIAAAILHGRVLIAARTDLAGIHLHSIAENWSAIAL